MEHGPLGRKASASWWRQPDVSSGITPALCAVRCFSQAAVAVFFRHA